MANRLSRLDDCLFDVLIIGAGINGCSAARQLTADGYRVLLVDRGDLGGITTARSGRVLHCGLQILQPRKSMIDYLRNPLDLAMRLRMARRTALDFVELCHLLRPQLEPMNTVVPIYRGGPISGWQVDFGAQLIKLMARNSAEIQYCRLDLEDGLSNPFVCGLADRDRLRFLVSFRDHRFHWPERIAIDAALDAEECGAEISNFTEVIDLRRTSGGLWRAKLLDTLNGQDIIETEARLVLNLTGAWVDQVSKRIHPHVHLSKKVVAVKGAYILVKLPEKYRGAGIAGMNSLGEPICCLPWDDLHYIGPTETVFEGVLDGVRPEEEDVTFLIEEMRRFVPGLSIVSNDIVMAWAGIRPITASRSFSKGKRLPFNVLHDLANEGVPNMLTLSWGIVVNHLSTARAISNAVSARIPPSRAPAPVRWPVRCFPATQSQRLQEDHAVTVANVRFCVEREHARDLTGVLFSRTGLAWCGRMTAQSIRLAAMAMAPLLSWDAERVEFEIDNFRTHLRVHHRYEVDRK